MTAAPIEQLSINTIRTLSIDAVQQANSGHPGAPMGLAPVAYELWQKFLRFDPDGPLWPNRDRFVLSNGHASMLLYSLLHLAQVKAVTPDYQVTDRLAVPLEDIKRFRQLDSRCPGHPEYHHTSGIETTTGPLGQGLGNSVGFAIAERWLAAHFNRPGHEIFNYNVYAFCGDGCMMEGISHEAGSLAGHLKLSNLCWLYDFNAITIEGHTDLALSDDVAERFEAYGWNVTAVPDANNLEQVARAIQVFQESKDRPTLIIVHSHIGYGSPNKQDTRDAHGEALGEEEVRLTKRAYGWPEDAKFLIPDGVLDDFRNNIGKRGREAHAAWKNKFADYKAQFSDLAAQIEAMQHRELPDGWDKNLPSFPADPKGVATRDSGGKVLNALAQNIPWLMGGAADLYPSTKTRLTFEGAGDFEPGNYGGRNFHFGIREHGMIAACNGMVLSKIRAYGSSFFIFTDYCKPAIRLAALMEIPLIVIMTHDSIGLGEDGPTHQAIEQLATFRATPGIIVLRPADSNEVVEAYKVVMKLKHEPAIIVLTRQAIPTFDRTKCAPASGVAKGAYVLLDAPGGKPDAILMGTGSEVQWCMQAQEQLAKENIQARVVSMPSWELFRDQPQEYRESVLPAAVKVRVAIEAGSPLGWDQFIGPTGVMIGMTTFGASAPIKDLMKKFGFTAEHVVTAVKSQLDKK
ncbi:MAG: transketolase [Candidatus Acidiferrales bacterium]